MRVRQHSMAQERAEAVRQRKAAQPPPAEGEAGNDDAQRDAQRGGASSPSRPAAPEEGTLL